MTNTDKKLYNRANKYQDKYFVFLKPLIFQNGKHWYGKISYHDKNGEYQSEELERPLSLNEAKKLGKPYEISRKTERFDSISQLKSYAIDFVKDKILVVGESGICRPYKILTANGKLSDYKLKMLNSIFEEYKIASEDFNRNDNKEIVIALIQSIEIGERELAKYSNETYEMTQITKKWYKELLK